MIGTIQPSITISRSENLIAATEGDIITRFMNMNNYIVSKCSLSHNVLLCVCWARGKQHIQPLYTAPQKEINITTKGLASYHL